jgi:asparagine synthetase B (glutamine-hydrolysing)
MVVKGEMPGLLALFSDPGVYKIDGCDAIWLVSGARSSARQCLERTIQDNEQCGEEICRQYGDVVVVKVVLENGQPVAVSAWKGITSGYEIFHAVRPNGDVVLADHFRNILACVPVPDRHVRKDALVDHFLFRRASPDSAYCDGIARLGHGEAISINLASGDIKTSIFDRIRDQACDCPTETYLNLIHHALASALDPLATQQGIVNLFSGGVDATLIQTYLGPHIMPLTYLPENGSERDAATALEAAQLLGVEVQSHKIDERDYATKLDDTIEAIGVPSIRPHTVLIHDALTLDFQMCISGHGADALFGRNVRSGRLASFLSSRSGLAVLGALTSLDRITSSNRWQSRQSIAKQMSEDPGSPFGYGAQRGVIAQCDLVEGLFGPTRLRERLVARREFLEPRVEFVAPLGNSLLRHLEVAHWIEFLWEDRLTVLRHLAHAQGKSMFAPFFSKAVVDSATQVPVDRRYMKGLEGKYLLKQLLKNRLPTYPVNQKKGSTRPPFEQYFKEGALKDIWERYEMPNFFDESIRRHISAHPSDLTWSSITFAIWRDKVLRNPDLQRIPGTLALEWE